MQAYVQGVRQNPQALTQEVIPRTPGNCVLQELVFTEFMSSPLEGNTTHQLMQGLRNSQPATHFHSTSAFWATPHRTPTKAFPSSNNNQWWGLTAASAPAQQQEGCIYSPGYPKTQPCIFLTCQQGRRQHWIFTLPQP